MLDRSVQLAYDAISAYLAHHPMAADTAEGIHQYWIQWDGIPEMQHITEIALAQLEQDGLIEPIQIGGRLLWRRKRSGDIPEAKARFPED